MIGEAVDGADYVLSDYLPVPRDHTKKSEEAAKTKIAIERYARQEFGKRFSAELSLDDWPLFESQQRLRSEIHAVSSRLYDRLRPVDKVVYDYGLQMISMARRHRMGVRRVDLGPLPEFGEYSEEKARLQELRIAFQLDQLAAWMPNWPLPDNSGPHA